MTINTIASSLDLWEGLKRPFFEKNSIFNEHLYSEDDVIHKTWWQIFLVLRQLKIKDI